MGINDYGWDETFEREFVSFEAQGLVPARVIMRSRDNYKLFCGNGVIAAKLSGKYKHASVYDESVPVVGDWVAAQINEGASSAMIQAIVTRKTCFSRKPAVSGGRKIRNGIIQGGATVEQVLAANIDTVFIVSGLDNNFNISRIERYLTVACSSGANPVVLLNKADLCADPDEYVSKAEEATCNVQVHCISAASGAGMEALNQYMVPGRTLAFLGSSGVGKSTIINCMFGEGRQITKTTSEYNGKGRHTTTCAELFLHETGCMLIDTPGLRELKLWCGEEAFDESFEDVLLLVSRCRFGDCRHEKEPGCAVKEAMQSGQLTMERYNNFKKLYIEVQDLKERKKQRDLYIARLIKRQKMGR